MGRCPGRDAARAGPGWGVGRQAAMAAPPRRPRLPQHARPRPRCWTAGSRGRGGVGARRWVEDRRGVQPARGRGGEPELRRAARAGPGPTAARASHFCAPVCSPGVDQRWVCLPRNAVTGGALAGVLAPKEACGAVARETRLPGQLLCADG